jgi:diacylglycerol kinase family enzyme
MNRIVVIANPAASQFTGGAHRDVMALLSRGSDVASVWPGSATEAEERSRASAEDGADIVVAMGGDGMVHHVTQGLVGTRTALGVIPVGTTNVFARLMEIPSKPTKAARLFLGTPTTRSVGVATMSLRRGSTETTHHAVFACGVGLDAAVVQRAEREPYRKYRFGSIHYARSALGTAFQDFPRRRPHVSVRSRDTEGIATAALVQFRDIYTYFGRIPLRFARDAPEPMSAFVMGRLKRRAIPRIVTALLMGRDLGTIPEIEVWRKVELLEMEADPPIEAQADGEALGMVDGGSITWSPSSLTVVVPQPAAG